MALAGAILLLAGCGQGAAAHARKHIPRNNNRITCPPPNQDVSSAAKGAGLNVPSLDALSAAHALVGQLPTSWCEGDEPFLLEHKLRVCKPSRFMHDAGQRAGSSGSLEAVVHHREVAQHGQGQPISGDL